MLLWDIPISGSKKIYFWLVDCIMVTITILQKHIIKTIHIIL